ncbi:MAG: hypothetical protein LBC59_03495 [Chitinispirillales bacterium]|jgi:hypothetical protein|nr:hypothetical protein [Chitinispirillales bacterium]
MINKRFNEELQMQIEGTLPAGHVYQLGRPGEILRSAGIPDLDIELNATMLKEKSDPNYKNPHPFNLSDIRGLPKAIQYPIMVFDSKTRVDCKVILTELKSGGVNFVVAMEVYHKRGANKSVVEINSIRSLYPKDQINDIFVWSNDGLLRYVNKEKASAFVSQRRSQFPPKWSRNAEAQMLNIINKFKNPSTEKKL